MLTGEIRGKIDSVWNAFWSGGISNPLEVIEGGRLDELRKDVQDEKLEPLQIQRILKSGINFAL